VLENLINQMVATFSRRGEDSEQKSSEAPEAQETK
jgi:hypothetical protein